MLRRTLKRFGRWRRERYYASLLKPGELVFLHDYVSQHTGNWERIFAEFKDKPEIHGLEIGSHEGRSAVWFLSNILTHPTSTLTCVDPLRRPELRAFFEHNTAASGHGHRLVLIPKGSENALLEDLAGRTFDLVYVDGIHSAPAVLFDALFAWPRVKTGGILLFDDYEWCPEKPPGWRPKPAIDKFLQIHGDELELLHRASQIAVRKTTGCRVSAASEASH